MKTKVKVFETKRWLIEMYNLKSRVYTQNLRKKIHECQKFVQDNVKVG